MAAVLYLVRHGIAQSPSLVTRDEDRCITEDGARELAAIGRGLRRLGISPALILSSPLLRAVQTAEILGCELDTGTPARVWGPLAPGHSPERIVDEIAAFENSSSLMLVGHQPTMGELASTLVTGSRGLADFPFSPGAVAAVSVHAIPPREPGSLLWFVDPRALQAIGR